MTETLDAALAWHAAGACVIRATVNGEKRPMGEWDEFQEKRSTEAQLRQWFSNGHAGMGLVCGAVSGNLEMSEFEGRAIAEGVHDAFLELVALAGLRPLWERIAGGYTEATPSGGLHFLYRLDGAPVPGNEKLAQRPATDAELATWKESETAKAAAMVDEDKRAKRLAKIARTGHSDVPQVLIETRGEGGFVVTAPSNGTTHPTGKPWLLVRGGPSTVATITGDERTQLFRLLRALDQMPAKVTRGAPQATRSASDGLRPGDDYNARSDWTDILEADGWQVFYIRDQVTYWTRPGKATGVSASTNATGNDTLIVFTSSTDFEQYTDTNRVSYSKFGAYALLEHGGDHQAAARALARQGYGDRVDGGDRQTELIAGIVGAGDPSATEQGSNLPALLPPPSAPMKVARRLLEPQVHDGHLTLRHWRDGWMRWHRTHWTEVDIGDVRAGVYRATEDALYLHFDEKKGEQRLPWNPTKPKVANVMESLGAAAYLDANLDPPAWIASGGVGAPVAVANGLLDVATRELSPHTARYFNLASVPFAYDPATTQPRRWLRFLADLWGDDPEPIAALQEWFGYVISGRTDLQKMLLLVGPTRGGKGTIVHVLTLLVGALNIASPSLASLTTNFGLSPLLGKPLAVIADARLGRGDRHQVVEKLLNISGEDSVDVDRKFRDPWTGKLPTRIMMLSNELPNLGDASAAIVGRFIVLVLTKSWLGQEDTTLKSALADEAPGILNWALDGLARLEKRGRFTEPASSDDAVVTMRDVASPVAAFVRECCEVGPAHEADVDAVWTAWKSWAEDNGARTGRKQELGRDLNAVVPGLKVVRPRVVRTGPQPKLLQEFIQEESQSSRVRRYMGLRIAPQWQSVRTSADRADHDPPPPEPTADKSGDASGCRSCGQRLLTVTSKARGICVRCEP